MGVVRTPRAGVYGFMPDDTHARMMEMLLDEVTWWYHAQDWKLEITTSHSYAFVLHCPDDVPCGWLMEPTQVDRKTCNGCGASVPVLLAVQFQLIHQPHRRG